MEPPAAPDDYIINMLLGSELISHTDLTQKVVQVNLTPCPAGQIANTLSKTVMKDTSVTIGGNFEQLYG